MKDKYDFTGLGGIDQAPVTSVPVAGKAGILTGEDFKELEKAGLAKPFDVNARWQRRISGRIVLDAGKVAGSKFEWKTPPSKP